MRFRKSEYSALDAAMEAAQRFWAGILCNTRVYIGICSKSKKAGVAVVILFLTTLAIQGQTVIERYNDTLTTYTELQDVSKVDTRQTIWAVAIEIIKDNLWTGIGPGRFHVEQLSFTPYDNTRDIECETGNTCNTHNTILQFTTSAGIAAGALYLSLIHI